MLIAQGTKRALKKRARLLNHQAAKRAEGLRERGLVFGMQCCHVRLSEVSIRANRDRLHVMAHSVRED